MAKTDEKNNNTKNIKSFSIPYTYKLSKIINGLEKKELLKNNKIKDIYFSDGILNSARNIYLNDQEKEEIKKLKKKDFSLNYIFNPQYYNNNFYRSKNLKRFLNLISNIKDFYNIDMITLNNTILLNYKDFRDLLDELKIEIKLSVNNKIDNLEKLKIMFYEFGIKNLTLDRSLNRNWDELEKIAEFAKLNDIDLSLLVNEGCLPNCPFKEFCDLTISQTSSNQDPEIKLNVESLTCNSIFINHFEKTLQSPFISPLWLNDYLELYDFTFKISGRNKPKKILEKIIYDYFLQRNDCEFEHFFSTYRPKVDFNFYDLEEYGFFKKVKNCKLQCHSCPNQYQTYNYCSDIALKLLKI